jgi:hypothetical protein
MLRYFYSDGRGLSWTVVFAFELVRASSSEAVLNDRTADGHIAKQHFSVLTYGVTPVYADNERQRRGLGS